MESITPHNPLTFFSHFFYIFFLHISRLYQGLGWLVAWVGYGLYVFVQNGVGGCDAMGWAGLGCGGVRYDGLGWAVYIGDALLLPTLPTYLPTYYLIYLPAMDGDAQCDENQAMRLSFFFLSLFGLCNLLDFLYFFFLKG